MAVEQGPFLQRSLIAGADLSAASNQFKVVEYDANGEIVIQDVFDAVSKRDKRYRHLLPR